MGASTVRCSHCEWPLPAQAGADWTSLTCSYCGETETALVFPAVAGLRFERPKTGEAVEGRSLCFFHNDKPAAVPCDICGRFLCSLCDLAFEGGHYCAACLDAAQNGDADASGKAVALLKEKTFLPQNLALLLSLYLPFTLFGLYFIPLTAPAAIFISLRYWNRNEGVQRRGKWAFVISILLSVAQLAAVAAIAIAVWYSMKAAPKGVTAK